MYNNGILSSDSKKILNSIPELISKTFPIPGKFRSALPSDIAELSRLLTNNRGERSLSYLSRPNFLSAYLYYFLPWNLFRLCRLLPSLDIQLSAGKRITDLGSGPLTFVSALWISRPDLRSVPLEFNCVDRVKPVLKAGKDFFSVLSAEANVWKINFGESSRPSDMVCAVNMFNEQYDRISHNNSEELKMMAANAANLMSRKAGKDACILTVEPGVPQSGRFISFLRSAFLELGHQPASPCTHNESCPFSQGDRRQSKKWCHFAFESIDAPKELQRLSIAAKLPKDRLVLSYLLTKTGKERNEAAERDIRVISDAFPLPGGKFGRYGCSAQGLVLLSGNKNRIEELKSLSVFSPVTAADGKRDEKSGALILELE